MNYLSLYLPVGSSIIIGSISITIKLNICISIKITIKIIIKMKVKALEMLFEFISFDFTNSLTQRRYLDHFLYFIYNRCYKRKIKYKKL